MSCHYSPMASLLDDIARAGLGGQRDGAIDILARERNLPRMEPGDLIGVLDAGAYGYSMCSNYNNRLRPAEVLIRMDGTPALIRRRETLKDLSRLDPDLSDTIHSSEGDDEIEVRGARRRAVGGQVF